METSIFDEVPIDCYESLNILVSTNTSHMLMVRSEWLDYFW